MNGAKSELGQAADVAVETGRWYDLKIVVHGADIQCYLDGKTADECRHRSPPCWG